MTDQELTGLLARFDLEKNNHEFLTYLLKQSDEANKVLNQVTFGLDDKYVLNSYVRNLIAEILKHPVEAERKQLLAEIAARHERLNQLITCYQQQQRAVQTMLACFKEYADSNEAKDKTVYRFVDARSADERIKSSYKTRAEIVADVTKILTQENTPVRTLIKVHEYFDKTNAENILKVVPCAKHSTQQQNKAAAINASEKSAGQMLVEKVKAIFTSLSEVFGAIFGKKHKAENTRKETEMQALSVKEAPAVSKASALLNVSSGIFAGVKSGISKVEPEKDAGQSVRLDRG
ncbi:MAG: hypothetical protein K0S08_1582 [Gammaproteobacteria bacterium]|jgi:hypothetical protein|nr:hypothetical protein [Gammaproteobacteria bacterium]